MTEFERYLGAWVTPDLIGRDELLTQIEQPLKTVKGPTIIALYGHGGIGKTRLLRDALRRQRERNPHAAARIIDLYDIQYHNSLDLAQAMHAALAIEEQAAFRDFTRAVDRLQRIQASGDADQIRQATEDALAKFSAAIRKLADQQPVIIALDTVERVAYGASETNPPFQEAQSWRWLIKSLPGWGNVALLIAGRNQIRHLFSTIEQANIALTTIEVLPFNEAETTAYLRAVAKAAEQSGYQGLADTLNALRPEQVRKIHRYSGGLPILQALLADYISLGMHKELPDSFQTEMEPDQAGRLLEEELIERLIRFSKIRDTVLMLGRAPKGLNAAMLARLLDVTTEEAEQRLSDVEKLSFVKARNQLVFLHDEMYAMLHRQVYNDQTDMPEAERVNSALIAWYDDEIKKQRQQLDRLFAPIEESPRAAATMPRPDLSKIARVRQFTNQLLIDRLYYSLRRNVTEGFKEFVRRVFDAQLGSNPTLLIQIQAEILAFFDERDALGDPIDGRYRALVEHLISLDPLFGEARGDEQSLRNGEQLSSSSHPDLIAAMRLMSRAHQRRDKRELWDQAEELLKKLVKPSKESHIQELEGWLAKVLLARLYQLRGYAASSVQSIAAYERTVPLWRQVNIPIGLARTLNHLGFRRITIGDIHNGLALIREALELRRKLGERAQIGVSHSTLARALIHTEAYEQATEHAELALRLCRVVGYRVGEGLALRNLAEIRRRSTRRENDVKRRLALLQEAHNFAREAAAIFTELDDNANLIEAFIEEGCVLRDIAGILTSHNISDEDPAEVAGESVEVLRQAATLAREMTREMNYINALVSIASVGVSVKQFNYLWAGLRQVRDNIPRDYEISVNGRPADRDQRDPLIFWQLARIHIRIAEYLLYALDRPEHLKRLPEEYSRLTTLFSAGGVNNIAAAQDALAQAIRHYALAFEYDDLYNPLHVRSQAVQDRICERFRAFDYENLQLLAKTVQAVEQEFQISNSFMRRLLRSQTLLLEEEDF